jgi:hypothetical protein
MKDEKGQALPLALAALAVGVLLITPFLESVSVHSIASRTYRSSILQLCSSDAGVEDAIWALTNGSLAAQLTAPGDSASHSLSESVNGVTPSVSVTRDKVIIASDDFESGGWSGGSGWSAAWTQSGDASIVTTDSPYEGSYHFMLQSNTGYAKRSVDLSGHPSARLQFWAKANSFEGSEAAYCKISSDGSDWTTVKTWADGDDDNAYHFWDIDLSSYTLSSQFWIAFEANMQQTSDYLYVDDIEVVRVLPGSVLGLPSDDFETGGWSGGSGWSDDWYHEGDETSITTQGSPYEGSYHLRMRKGDSYVKRAADLSGQSGLHLQLWAKVDKFESDDEMYCRVSPDDNNWTTVKTWTDADDDNTYHLADIDLSPYTMSSEFWIVFDSGMDHQNDYFYVDDLRIVGTSIAYEIVSTAGSEETRADIVIEDGDVSIRAWQMERQ